MKSRAISALLAAFLALAVAPARATMEYDYAKGEYAVIVRGLAPNGRMSLSSHGDGDGGRDNFQVWLMAEPTHRKLVRVPGIGPEGILDTGPTAYFATWSPDSRHVAVTYRSDRHVVEFNLYEIEGRRAHLMKGPSLFRDVSSREVGSSEDMRRSLPEVEWKGARRFLLRESRLFLTSDPAFARMLGRYGRITDKRDDGSFFVEFSAEADCVVLPGHRYRIVDLRVGEFSEYCGLRRGSCPAQ
jgi:hypothetical protein